MFPSRKVRPNCSLDHFDREPGDQEARHGTHVYAVQHELRGSPVGVHLEGWVSNPPLFATVFFEISARQFHRVPFPSPWRWELSAAKARCCAENTANMHVILWPQFGHGVCVSRATWRASSRLVRLPLDAALEPATSRLSRARTNSPFCTLRCTHATVTKELLIGFFGGIGTALAGALLASLIERYNERQRRLEDARFQVYMALLEIDATYFWVTTLEFHKETVPDDMWEKLYTQSWKLLDQLRKTDEVELLDETVQVLMNENFASAILRAEALNNLIDRFASKVNPRYMKAIRRVSEENILRRGSSDTTSPNAPGTPLNWKRAARARQESEQRKADTQHEKSSGPQSPS